MKLAEAETARPASHPSRSSPAARALGAACLGAALLSLLAARRRPSPPRAATGAMRRTSLPVDLADDMRGWPSMPVAAPAVAPAERALRPNPVRSLHGAAALLALSVLADSAIEHYRGGFENPGMLAPLVASLATAFTSLRAAGSTPAPPTSAAPAPPTSAAPARTTIQNNVIPAQAGIPFRTRADYASAQRRADRVTLNEANAIYPTAIAIGLAGTAFHLYNIGRRPGSFSWQNLFYAAPLGAPAALALAGLFGLAARRIEQDRRARLLGHPAARTLAVLTAGGIAGTTMEAALLHFRGAFHRVPMWLPVTIPPVTAALLLRAAGEARTRLAHAWLGATALLGIAGVLFHASGVHRQMGGWHNWRQNLLAGPPLPAPPSFLALALAGRAALALAEGERATQRPT